MDEQSKHKTLDQLRETRIEKVNALREKGVNPYPYSYDVSNSIESLFTDFDKLKESQ